MMQQKRVISPLLVVIAVALGLRVWGIDFGLPYDFTYDEPHEILRAFKLGAGEYDWQGAGKGGLYYLLFVEYGVIYVLWRLMGWVGNSQDFALQYFRDPSVFYLAGRLTVAVMGAMTCLVVFWLGRRLYDWRVGLGAAAIGAMAYLHGMWSHVINVDIGMILALWASILAYLKYEAQRQLRWLLAAGALGGVAIAFKLPGAIVFFVLFLAVVTHTGGWRSPRQRVKEIGLVLGTLLVVLTVMAPETTWSLTSLHRNFSQLLEPKLVADASPEANMSDAVNMVTIYRDKDWVKYVKILFDTPNLALTLTALLGVGVGLLRRHRWSIILSVFVVTFIGIFTTADRSGADYYILPVMPALWLLSSLAIVTLFQRHQAWMMAGFAGVVVVPLMTLAYQNYMWTQPDTRVLAKHWIEANIPSGATILMDGMRYRFVQSPPLNPDTSTVAHRVVQTSGARRVSRGVSEETLALYAKAMQQVEGPMYRLHSTVWGLEVEDLDYYVQACFDYIVTSSSNSERYASETDRQRFPKSVQFYEQLKVDRRFQEIYAIGPVPWERGGPTITVYEVLPACGAS